MDTKNRDAPDLLSIGTAVVWIACEIVGVLGLVLRMPAMTPKPPERPPTVAQLVHVELTPEADPVPQQPAVSTDDVPPPAPSQALVAAPPLMTVAEPSPSIAFAEPVKAPASPPPPPAPQQAHTTAAAPPDVPTHLNFGQGEGRQPSPEYPREAALAREQGTVVVQFVVGEDGRVRSAEAVVPSPFPLLNQAAIRAVIEKWRFAPGAVRSFEVSIQFQLRQKS